MTAVIVCGMPDEKRVLTAALKPGTVILSGTDKLSLDAKIPASCTRIISMGLCGGLSPELVVPQVALATTVSHKHGIAAIADFEWNERAAAAAARADITLHPVAYYSDGLQNEANTPEQRAALFAKYGVHAIDDETRFVVAEAMQDTRLPFNVVRPLSDDYSAKLPLLATGNIMNPDGSPNMAYLISVLGQDQGENSESVVKVMDDYRRSLDALEKVAKAFADLIASE
jgi:Phosphorylase superfamily